MRRRGDSTRSGSNKTWTWKAAAVEPYRNTEAAERQRSANHSKAAKICCIRLLESILMAVWATANNNCWQRRRRPHIYLSFCRSRLATSTQCPSRSDIQRYSSGFEGPSQRPSAGSSLPVSAQNQGRADRRISIRISSFLRTVGPPDTFRITLGIHAEGGSLYDRRWIEGPEVKQHLIMGCESRSAKPLTRLWS
jgi:hypothetical protein